MRQLKFIFFSSTTCTSYHLGQLSLVWYCTASGHLRLCPLQENSILWCRQRQRALVSPHRLTPTQRLLITPSVMGTWTLVGCTSPASSHLSPQMTTSSWCSTRSTHPVMSRMAGASCLCGEWQESAVLLVNGRSWLTLLYPGQEPADFPWLLTGASCLRLTARRQYITLQQPKTCLSSQFELTI